jgi:hypothetical protein
MRLIRFTLRADRPDTGWLALCFGRYSMRIMNLPWDLLLQLIGWGGPAAGIAINILIRQRRRSKELQKLLEGFPFASIREARDGSIGIKGRVHPLELIRAPLSGAQVVGYRVKLERRIGLYGWSIIADVSVVNDFELRDTTGCALIKSSSNQLVLKRTLRKKIRLTDPHPRDVLSFVSCHMDCLQEPIGDNVLLRWSEFLLQSDDEVLICGDAKRELDTRQQVLSYREPPTRLIILPRANSYLLILDYQCFDLLKRFFFRTELPPLQPD